SVASNSQHPCCDRPILIHSHRRLERMPPTSHLLSFRLIALRLIPVLAGLMPAALVADNGDLLATSSALQGKQIPALCADADGTFWALGETTGKIYPLDATLQKIGEIPNPHGAGSIIDLVLSRGIAFRAASGTLLVMAQKQDSTASVKEVT